MAINFELKYLYLSIYMHVICQNITSVITGKSHTTHFYVFTIW
jgi:hypothetical protein